jgi:hypothetical protein
MMFASCDEPETVVTNIVNSDGSVTRKIEMRNSENKFKKSEIQVPFDSTWVVTDTCEINDKGDTTWIKSAVKLFKNVDEINLAYRNDSGANKMISRQATFKKTFKWFNTEYRFSEKIDQKISEGYPIGDFLNEEELLFFYSPAYVKEAKMNGNDSLKFKAIHDSVDRKTETWTTKILVSEWINEFSKLVGEKDGVQLALDSLKSHEDELVELIQFNEEEFDSLWSNGTILKKYLGDIKYQKYIAEADTIFEKVIEQLWLDFSSYTVRIEMPGNVIGNNGFIDSGKSLLWPVRSDFFLTETYEMWAKSKTTNRWAWIVSGLFLVFVLTGVLIRVIKKD